MCIINGSLKIISYFFLGKPDTYTIPISVILIILGIIIMLYTTSIISFFRIIIGIWIIYSGIINLQTAIVWKDYKSKIWVITLILSLVLIIAGIYILLNTGVIVQTIGVIIVLYAIINIIQKYIFMKKTDKHIEIEKI